MICDVVISGGGPSGSRAAEALASAGCSTIVVEEHEEIGAPVQCAGLVSPRVVELGGYSRSDFIPLKGATLHSPSGHKLTATSDRTYAVPIDRMAFDRSMADKASAAGAKFVLGRRTEGFTYEDGGVVLRGTDGLRVRAQMLIAADGSNSVIGRLLGLRPQERVRMAAMEMLLGPDSAASPGKAEVFLSNAFAPGWFGWLFPLGGGLARVGVGACGNVPPGKCLTNFICSHPEYFEGYEPVKTTGGVVPIGPPRATFAERVILLGDAAAYVKPVSGGGLYLGLQAAVHAAQTALEALSQGDFGDGLLSGYERRCAAMRKEIQLGLSLRKFFISLNEREMDNLVRFFSNRFWTSKIAAYGDVDYPSALAAAISRTGMAGSAFARASRFLPALMRKIMSAHSEVAATVSSFAEEDQ